MHIYRWDLDKTYLDTDIDSVRGLIRTALEGASDKRNVPGSAALLRALTRWDPTAKVEILSGSPTQMRAVLEEKLALDGVRVDALTLKDNLRNLRRGRIRAVKGQVGYKLPELLRRRVGLGPRVHETLFGDDSEVDALVYAVYADALAGRLSESDVARIMEAGGAYSDSVEVAVRAMRQIGRSDAIDGIFIHVGKGVSVRAFRRLGRRVVPVFSWLQSAIALWDRGRLGAPGVEEVARAAGPGGEIDETALAGLVQDVVRRGLVAPSRIDELLETATGLAAHAPAVRLAVRRLGTPPPPPQYADPPEYLAFLRLIAG